MEAKKKRGRSAAGKKRHWVKEALEDERMSIGSWIKEELEDGNEELKEGTYLFSPDVGEVIERKETVKELGVFVDQDLDFKSQRQKVLSKIWRKLGCISRTFSTRSVQFLKTVSTSLV